MPRVEIRPARPSDRARAVALLVRQMEEHDLTVARAALARAVGTLLARPALGRVLVARLAGRTIGVAVLSFVWTIEHGGASSWLDELYVEPAHRGSGIGTALLRAAIAAVVASGARAIDLEVVAGHERAANLYRREGFVRHTRERWVYHPPRRRSRKGRTTA
jgi:GNAT superfamily N-acetyltransferase